MKQLLCALTISGFLMAVNPAKADIYCYGGVDEAFVQIDGAFAMHPTWRNDWVTLCNVKTTYKGVDSTTCLAWYTIINNAILYNKVAGVYYAGYNNESDCASIPTYATAPAPIYVRLSKVAG
jgi:hypothetical protein